MDHLRCLVHCYHVFLVVYCGLCSQVLISKNGPHCLRDKRQTGRSQLLTITDNFIWNKPTTNQDYRWATTTTTWSCPTQLLAAVQSCLQTARQDRVALQWPGAWHSSGNLAAVSTLLQPTAVQVGAVQSSAGLLTFRKEKSNQESQHLQH